MGDDIVKQLFDEKSLKNIKVECEIKNAFIFPCYESYLSKAKIRDRTNSSWLNHIFIEEFKTIHCYYVNRMEVIKKLITGEEISDLTELLLTDSE